MNPPGVDYSAMTLQELTTEQERLSDALLEGNVPCNPEERLELLVQLKKAIDNPLALQLFAVEEEIGKKVAATIETQESLEG